MEDKKVTCDRCEFVFSNKYNLIRHLESSNVCTAKTPEQDIVPAELINKYKARKYTQDSVYCEVCQKQFKTLKTLKQHVQQQHSRNRNNQKAIETMQKQIQKLEQKLEQTQNPSQTNLFNLTEKIKEQEQQIMALKNKRTEAYYQTIMEKILAGSHKTLKIGITDVTNQNLHAEIKTWESYKEGTSQLLYYNAEDPKQELHLYLFGKGFTNKEYAQYIANTTKEQFKINMYMLKTHQSQGCDTIVCHDMCTNTPIWTTKIYI